MKNRFSSATAAFQYLIDHVGVIMPDAALGELLNVQGSTIANLRSDARSRGYTFAHLSNTDAGSTHRGGGPAHVVTGRPTLPGTVEPVRIEDMTAAEFNQYILDLAKTWNVKHGNPA